MPLPAWYETYLMLRKAKIHPFIEPASIPFLANAWNVHSAFITPHSDEPPASLNAVSLLPSIWDSVLDAPPPSFPLTHDEVQAIIIASQNKEKPPEFISAVPPPPPPPPPADDCEGSERLKRYLAGPQQKKLEEKAGIQAYKKEDDINEKTRRIASTFHIMVSKKLEPSKVSDDEARALIELQLKTKAPLLPPWYRHANSKKL